MKNKKSITIITAVLLFCGMIAMVSGFSIMLSNRFSEKKKVEGESDFLAQAKYYADNSKYQEALILYQKANAINDNNLETLHAMGEIYNSLEYYEQEKAIYEEIIEKEGNSTDSCIKLAQASINLGQLEEAKDIVEEGMQTDNGEELSQLYEVMDIAPPHFNLQSGEYDSYQLLELLETPNNVAVFYTLDGSDPTSDSQQFTDGLVISAPETQIRAKAISYLGYESDIVDLNFHINVPIEEIGESSYSSLENYVRNEYLHREWDEPIYTYEVAQIRSLYMVGSYNVDIEPISVMFYSDGFSRYERRDREKGAGEIELIQYMPFLKELAICYQEEVDLEKLSELKYLENLSLLNDGIMDIDALRNLTSLKMLSLGWNEIQDVSPLAEMDQLVSLGLWNNQIQDVSSLSGLKNLNYFDVTENPVSDTSAVTVVQ